MKKTIVLVLNLLIALPFAYAQSNIFPNSGSVGIGTVGPAGALDIQKDPTIAGSDVYFTGQSGANQNSNSLRLNFVGYAQKAGYAIQALNITSYGGKDLVFYSHNTSLHSDYTSYDEAVRFTYNGKVGIGTSIPQASLDVNGNIYSNGKIFIGIPDTNTTSKIAPYALAVDGSAIFTKAVVKLKTNWPDYVFEPAYKNPSADSLEQFIKRFGHLPEMPAAQEANRNGIDLGENQILLLKKIEELTLIIIDQNKKIKSQDERIKELEKRIQIGK